MRSSIGRRSLSALRRGISSAVNVGNWVCINLSHLRRWPQLRVPRATRPAVLMAPAEPGHPFYESWRRGAEKNGWSTRMLPRAFDLKFSHQLLLYTALCTSVDTVHLIDVDLQTLFGEHNTLRRAMSFGTLRFIVGWPRMLGKRVTYSFGNYVPHEFDTPAERQRHRRVCSWVDGVISMCPSMTESLCQDGIPVERIWPVEHADISDYFEVPEAGLNLRHDFGIPGSAILLLCPGTIRPYKGIELAIEGLKKSTDPDLRLFISGKPAWTYTEAAIREMAKGDERIIVGPLRVVSNAEMGAMFREADYCVLPYRDIGHSGLVCQSLGLGVPVISSRVGCMPDYLERGAGILFEPDNVEQLAGILDNLRFYDRTRASAAGLALMRQRTVERIGDRLAAAYCGRNGKDHQPSWLF